LAECLVVPRVLARGDQRRCVDDLQLREPDVEMGCVRVFLLFVHGIDAGAYCTIGMRSLGIRSLGTLLPSIGAVATGLLTEIVLPWKSSVRTASWNKASPTVASN